MTRPAMAELTRWPLRHAWRSEADLAALTLCREQLLSFGLDLVDAAPEKPAQAAKMHGMEIVDAVADDNSSLQDLSRIAIEAAWFERLPPLLRRYMVHGERWHGVAMGIHRANIAWIHAERSRRTGLQLPTDVSGFMPWLQRLQAQGGAPLAVGAEPWQVGVLFENLVLAEGGAQLYRQAFVQLHASAWREPALQRALERLMALRGFVDDDSLHLGWAGQLDRVRRGEAAVQLMGDWARATGVDGLLETAAPGTADQFIAVMDYFVPLAGEGESAVAELAALALTNPAFQVRYAQRKGCMPALKEAWADVDPQRALLLRREDVVLPSLTFDQCCSVARKQALLAVVAEHFVHRRSAAACAQALSEALV